MVNQREAQLGYQLLLKSLVYKQTQAKVNSITPVQLDQAAAEIKKTGWCTDPAILDLKCQIQIIARKAPHSYAKCMD